MILAFIKGKNIMEIEAETSGRVAPHARLGQLGKQLADRSEDARVGGRVRPRRATDGRLVDIDHLVDVLEPIERIVGAGDQARSVEPARQLPIECLLHQRRLARARHACNADEAAEWELHSDVLQVVLASSTYP